MKNLLKNKSKFDIMIFLFIMSYLLFSIVAFSAEFYFRLSDSIPTLRAIWVFEFVDRWHWVFIIVFISYSILTFIIGNYLFARSMKKLYEHYQKQNLEYINEIVTQYDDVKNERYDRRN